MNIYVTDTHSEGKNWYRKYSNGWVEQGGYIEGLYDSKVALHVPMKDTNYTVLTGKNYTSATGSSAAINVYSKTTIDFTVNGRGQGGKGYGEAISGSWTVFGFAK